MTGRGKKEERGEEKMEKKKKLWIVKQKKTQRCTKPYKMSE